MDTRACISRDLLYFWISISCEDMHTGLSNNLARLGRWALQQQLLAGCLDLSSEAP